MITEEIKQITEKIKEALDPERTYLFGSYARNQETEASDYDFYVVVDEGKGTEPPYYYAIKLTLQFLIFKKNHAMLS